MTHPDSVEQRLTDHETAIQEHDVRLTAFDGDNAEASPGMIQAIDDYMTARGITEDIVTQVSDLQAQVATLQRDVMEIVGRMEVRP